jgi:hypothetical protein
MLNNIASTREVTMKKRFANLLWGFAGAGGYLASHTSNNPYISGNLGDVFVAGAVYFSARNATRFFTSKIQATIATMALTSLGELTQLAGIGIFPGPSDPKDYLAYALGTALALEVDTFMDYRNNSLGNYSLKL